MKQIVVEIDTESEIVITHGGEPVALVCGGGHITHGGHPGGEISRVRLGVYAVQADNLIGSKASLEVSDHRISNPLISDWRTEANRQYGSRH